MKLPTTPSFRLEDKRALIIGSSSGIGVGCAVALAEAGASVVLAARRVDLLYDLKNSLIDKIKSININKDPRGREKPSDHTPIEINLT